MDTNILIEFVKFCHVRVPIDMGVICFTDMSDGVVIEKKIGKVKLNHFYKGYDQWWDIKDIKSGETNLSKHGIDKCLEIFTSTI